MTKQEKQASAVAKHLVKALVGMEALYDGDPDDILEDARVILVGETLSEAHRLGVAKLLDYLQGYYN